MADSTLIAGEDSAASRAVRLSLRGPARDRPGQGVSAGARRPPDAMRDGIVRGDHDRRSAPQRGRRVRAGLPGHPRPARPEDAGAAAVGARGGCVHRRPRGPGRRRPMRVDSRGALKRGAGASSRSSACRRSWARSSSSTCASPIRARRGGIAPTPARTAASTRWAASADPRGRCRGCSTRASSSGSGRSPPPTSTAAASTRSTCVTRPALDSADRAFRFKALVKELAARDGLLATFMGKPFNDDEGSGFHLHISLVRRGGRERRLKTATGTTGLRRGRPPLHRGVLEHAPGDDGVLQPTVNAYRRINAEALVPTRV